MNYLDEFGLSDDDIKAIDKDIEEANEFFAKVSIKDYFTGESTESIVVRQVRVPYYLPVLTLTDNHLSSNDA
jgi:hypothetical protein